MSSSSPADKDKSEVSTPSPTDEDKSEVEIKNTSKIKLEGLLQDGPATGASEPELAKKSTKEDADRSCESHHSLSRLSARPREYKSCVQFTPAQSQ